jgi:phosphoenolpyruvate-protein kinase (PTS system EI component)
MPLFRAWLPMLAHVGGPLMHAAILAGEPGMPAVVVCGKAAMQLKTGIHVRMDSECRIVKTLAR